MALSPADITQITNLISTQLAANRIKISALPPAGTVGRDAVFPIVDSGSTQKLSLSQLLTLGVTVVENGQSLRSVDTTEIEDGSMWYTTGVITPNDGGEGLWIYDASSVEADNTGTVIPPDDNNGRFLRQYSGALNVQWFGATGNGTDDDTTALILAFATGISLKRSVYVPGTADYYKITDEIPIIGSGLTIFGDGPSSRINNEGTADALVLGDDVSFYRDIRIQGIKITGGDATGWGINALKSYNLRLIDFHCDVSSTGSGAVHLSECVNAVITGNVIGAVQGYGYKIENASFAPVLSGNRVDGISVAQGTGMYIQTRDGTLISNVTETLNVGIDLVGIVGLNIVSHYWEQCTIPLRDSALCSNVSITQGQFFTDATTAFCIDLQYTENFKIELNDFDGTNTGGAPIRIQSGNGALNGTIGPNTFDDADEVIFGARYADQNMVLVSEQKHFRPADYLQNSFTSWPAGTAAPPDIWDASAGTFARRDDAAFGRYGLDLIGTDARTDRRVLDITATQNANVRGRYVLFSVWAKTISGNDTFKLTIGDGVNTAELTNSATAGWQRWSIGIKVDAAATHIQLSITKLVSGTACFSAPSFYVGLTSPIAGVQNELDRAPIDIDAVEATHTGTLTETTIKSTTIPADSMGYQGAVRIRAMGSITGTNDVKVISLYFDTVLVAQVSEIAGATDDWAIDVIVQNISATDQVVNRLAYQGTAIEQQSMTTLNRDTTADVDVELKGDLANTNDAIVVKYFSVEPHNA